MDQATLVSPNVNGAAEALRVLHGNSDTFIRHLSRMFGKNKEIDGMRLGGQTIGNRFITNAYVYRVQ